MVWEGRTLVPPQALYAKISFVEALSKSSAGLTDKYNSNNIPCYNTHVYFIHKHTDPFFFLPQKY